jgi:hypothetical protein
MSAPDNAIPLEEELKDGGKNLGWFLCQGCGYRGHGSELLIVDDSKTLWCPICESIGWAWE